MDIERNIKRMYNYKSGAGDGTQFMDSCDTAIEALLELQKVINNNEINTLLCPVNYGHCENCNSKNIEFISDNHHTTENKMEYLEYYKCLNCGHKFVS